MMQLTMMQLQSKPRKSITGRLSRTGVDINASRNAAQDAVAEMRKRRTMYGRPKMSRTGVDLNEARNAARDAVAEMREMTIKHGRPLAGRYLDDRQRGKRRA